MARVHPVLVKSLDMSKIADLDNEALATQLLAFLEGEEAETGALSPLERQTVVTELVHDIKGLGPIEPLLADPEISDILVNGTGSTYVERRGRLEPVEVHFRDAQHMVHIAQRIAGRIGRRIDESSPMVDARLPDGSRVNIIIPPLALDGAAISIRRFVMRGAGLDDMAERQVLSPAMAELLRIGVKARLNILISGGTGAGKTTFMNALSREIPDGERLITIEDAAELQLQQPHVVRLETRTMSAEGTGEVTMRDLLVNTLRMRPDRIIVGEVRGAEANEMLQAMNTGHPGSMCTLHANNPRDALTRLENMLMSGSGDIPLPALRRQVAGSVDLVVQLARLRSGHRCVTSVTNVVGIENDIVTTEEMWRYRPGPPDSGNAHVFETSGPAAVVDGAGGRAGRSRCARRGAPGRPAHRGGGRMTPLEGALFAACAVAAALLAIVGLVLAHRRDKLRYIGRDSTLEQRLGRVAAPLAGPAAAQAAASGAASIFRETRRGSRLAWLRRPVESRYPLLDAARAVPVAVGAGIGGGGVRLALAVVSEDPRRRVDAAGRRARGLLGGLVRARRGSRRGRRRRSCASSPRWWTRWCVSPARGCRRWRRSRWSRRTRPRPSGRFWSGCATRCSRGSTPTPRFAWRPRASGWPSSRCSPRCSGFSAAPEAGSRARSRTLRRRCASGTGPRSRRGPRPRRAGSRCSCSR